ncbi:MAG TPA: histidine phosphatase family protein [Acidimicrobiales bacterium]|jgi:8-oxo-dGTP diphosphatase|nr:histidine phosphatase family protein [Acidimicrobiales bacterium]
MKLYVVRHAHAGSRSAWDGPDVERPLSRRGRKQAAGIADHLARVGVARLVSSPSFRCVESLQPLADRLGLSVDVDDRLLEGTDGEQALSLAGELSKEGTAAVICSHGDVIPDLLRILNAGTTRFKDPLAWPKGSIWVLTWDGEQWTKARYIPPIDASDHAHSHR